MKINHQVIQTVLFLSLPLACDFIMPKTVFEEPIKKRTINLAYHIGEQLTILRGTDTIKYDISHNKKSKFSYIVRNEVDTVFFGTVSKHKGMYLLNKRLQERKFRIYAIEQTDSTITGIESEIEQTYLIEEEIKAGNFSSAILDTLNQYILRADKKVGKNIFRSVLKKLTPDKLLFDEELIEIISQQDTSLHYNRYDQLENFTIIENVYPNPVTDILNIETNNSLVDYEFHLIDITGRILKMGILSEGVSEIDCSFLSQGEYFLVIKKTNESVKVIKK